MPADGRATGRGSDGKSSSGTTGQDSGSNNIKVCIRVRPFIDRERGEKCIIEMPTRDVIRVLDEDNNAASFSYDRCYWSHSKEDPQNGFADQNTLMEELGMELLNNAVKGYNDTLFAYGQTGSGKTWSVIGGKDMNVDAGLLPRMVQHIFGMLEARTVAEPDWAFQVRVSYLEIYNDKLRDLLNPKSNYVGPSFNPASQMNQKGGQNAAGALEVRQHPKFGIHVPGLTESASTSAQEVMKLMDFGMKARTVAATSMNDRSSRSHCIFTVNVTQIKGSDPSKPASLLRSKVNLVDLAGSERQKKTNATGDRLKEGAQINQSLTNLALVIHALAKSFSGANKNKGGGGVDGDFIPFRNSKLTYLLQESLVGNSRTVMIAAVSPARSNYEETLSTLRFANSVKEIQTKAVVNQEADADIIAQLKAEIAALKGGGPAGTAAGPMDPETQEQLSMLNDLVNKYGSNFRQEVEAAQKMESMRQQALVDMGLSGSGMAQAMNMNVHTPYLMNVADDPSLTGCLVYFIPINEEVTIGSDPSCTIKLTGLGIQPVMCTLINFNHTRVHVKPQPDPKTGEYGRLLRNGRAIGGTPTTLEARDRFMIGRSFIFKLVVPLQAQHTHQTHSPDGTLVANGASEGYIGDHLAEIMDNTSEEYMQAKSFVEHVALRIGEEGANNFLSAFAQAIPLVQESNDISNILRKKDNLLLRLDVVTDVMGYEASEPMLCVRLWKKEPAKEKMKRVFKRVTQNKKMNKQIFSVAMYLTGNGQDDDLYADAVIDNHRCQLLALWSWRSFLVRLAGMREAYDDYATSGELPTYIDGYKKNLDGSGVPSSPSSSGDRFGGIGGSRYTDGLGSSSSGSSSSTNVRRTFAEQDPWGNENYLDVRQDQTESLANYGGSSAKEVIEGLRMKLAVAERELQNYKTGRVSAQYQPKERSKKPTEAKMLAKELLAELRNMKSELTTWTT